MHTDDINTVDWSKTDTNMIATGSNDKLVSILDIRKLSSDFVSADMTKLCPAVVRQLDGHTTSINVVRWSTMNTDFLASCSETLNFWDLRQPNNDDALFFKHAGHVG